MKHFSYALSVFGSAFIVVSVILGSAYIWGPPGLIISSGVLGLSYMFIIMAVEGPNGTD